MNITKLRRFTSINSNSFSSSDETKHEEANNEEHKRSSSTLCNFNRAPDSNGGSAVIIEQMYRSTISLVETVTKSKKFNRQYKHSWNYTSHPTIIIWHPSKEWTIAILLKLLLIAWDMWTYRIGFKSKTSQRCGKVY